MEVSHECKRATANRRLRRRIMGGAAGGGGRLSDGAVELHDAAHEKGYYFTILMYGLFAAVSLQKSVRDRLEGTRVTAIYYALCWLSLLLAVLLLVVGLWNASLASSEKGFYAMAYLLSLFGSVAVQKNVRDIALHDKDSAGFPEAFGPLEG